MDNFAGKVAVITGAGSGFGREFARIGSQLGMKLVLADVQRDALDATATEMQAVGTPAIAEVVDVAKSEQVQRLADRAFGEFGNVICCSTTPASAAPDCCGRSPKPTGNG